MKLLRDKIRRFVRRKLAWTITNVATDEALVALTFDDGPNPEATMELLRILKAHAAKATFFMTGENAAAHPEIVSAVRDAGHALGNHSWDHPSFPLIPGRERREQIRRCADVLPDGGSRLFRPPYGHQSAASQWDTWRTGHQVVAWSVAVPDWEDHTGEWLAAFALERLRPGCVVLLHDGVFDFTGDARTGRGATLDAVERILAATRGKYEFVTIPELLRRGRPARTDWWMEPDIGFLNQLQRSNGIPRRYRDSRGNQS